MKSGISVRPSNEGLKKPREREKMWIQKGKWSFNLVVQTTKREKCTNNKTSSKRKTAGFIG